MLPAGSVMESGVRARRPVGRLGLVVLALMFFFMATLVNGQQPQTWAGTARRGERPVVGGIRWQLPDARIVPVTFGQLSQRSEQFHSQTPLSGQITCANLMVALKASKLRVERDERIATTTSGPDRDSAAKDPSHPAIDLQYDLKILEHAEAELNKCLVESNRTTVKRGPEEGCSSFRFLAFRVTHDGEAVHDIPIWRQPGSFAVFYESGLSVDADGAPNAYHPDNIGLDDLANAGAPGFWEGLAQDANGDPYIQGPDDPFPGYYVSATDLSDRTKAFSDPNRYVDASKIPYVVLPSGMEKQVAAHPGDFAVVFNLQNLKRSPAIFADTGPPNRIGEGSIALAENLGLWSDARNGGTTRGILYLVFPGSGNGRSRPIEEINAEAEQLFQVWGGIEQLTACGIW